MPDDDTKLDHIATQLGDLRVGITEVRGDTSAILGRLKDVDRRGDDHEARLRVIERIGAAEHAELIRTQAGQITELKDEIQGLKLWRAKLAGIAAGIGALIGTPIGAAAVFIATAMADQKK